MGRLHSGFVLSFSGRNILVYATLGTAPARQTSRRCADVSRAGHERAVEAGLVFLRAPQPGALRDHARTGCVAVARARVEMGQESDSFHEAGLSVCLASCVGEFTVSSARCAGSAETN